MFQLFKKEIAFYFTHFTAYISATSFVLISTLFLLFFDNEFNVFNIGMATLSSFFFIAPWILLFLIPALTMRTFAEEESSGTLQWLFTQPISIKGIVFGKYWAIHLVLLFSLLPSGLFVYTLNQFIIDQESLDYGVLLSAYLGLYLLGSSFIAIGLFTSSLVKNQVTAYVSAVFFCFLLFYAFEGLASYNLLGTADYYVQKLGMYVHYQQFLKGIVDSRDLVYYFLVMLAFLGGTYWNLTQKK